ncbi:zinc finger protein 543-like [Bacillus rossius redtenbacheri]|uniref:zinc finger protein 543-like n=1 Tax=Bacillus rossius redtenbacheri TaxID=93214 RepID=UPI002FDD9D87
MSYEMGEELLVPDCVGDGTHIVIHQVPKWQLSDESSNAPAVVAPHLIQSGDVGESGDRSSQLNLSQQKQQEEELQQYWLDVLNESLKMDLLFVNKDDPLQPQQSVAVVDDMPLGQLVDAVVTYSCRLCVFVASDVPQLLQHFSTTHCLALPQVVQDAAPIPQTEIATDRDQGDDELDNLVFICGFCNSNFTSLDDCKQHMSQVHKAFSPPSEGDATGAEPAESSWPAEKLLKIGGKKKKPATPVKEKKLRCNVPSCFRKFTTEDRLRLHTSCHVSLDGKSREFQCSKCDLRLERWNQCALHLWHAHQQDVDLLSCPTCGQYKTATQVKLTLHMKVHSDLKPYVCRVCNKGFKQSSQLRNHHVTHVDKKLLDADMPRWYTSQRCQICHKTYSDSKCLKKHMKSVHSKLRPYVCQVCGHASAGKSMLRMHMRQHTGDKPFKCTEGGCDFRTGDHNSLRRHVMRHTGERQYACPHCSYSAIQASAYKYHLRTRHPEASELHACSLCPYRSVNAESLAHHEADHKHGLVASRPARSSEDEGDCEVFPGNVAAAHLIYRCFNPDSSARGATMRASLTGSQTSPDGSTQTITVRIPAPGTDDDDSSRCFLEEEEGPVVVDTGGITIPADPAESTFVSPVAAV